MDVRCTSLRAVDDALSTGRIGGAGVDVGEVLSLLGVDVESVEKSKGLLLVWQDDY